MEEQGRRRRESRTKEGCERTDGAMRYQGLKPSSREENERGVGFIILLINYFLKNNE